MHTRGQVRRGERRHPVRLAPAIDFHLGAVRLREQLQLALRDENFIRGTGGLKRRWYYFLRRRGFFCWEKLNGCIRSYFFFRRRRGRGNGDRDWFARRFLQFLCFGFLRKLLHLYPRPMIRITSHSEAQHQDSHNGGHKNAALAGKECRRRTLYRNRLLSQSWRGRGGPGGVSRNNP